jgi:hypothetical protein
VEACVDFSPPKNISKRKSANKSVVLTANVVTVAKDSAVYSRKMNSHTMVRVIRFIDFLNLVECDRYLAVYTRVRVIAVCKSDALCVMTTLRSFLPSFSMPPFFGRINNIHHISYSQRVTKKKYHNTHDCSALLYFLSRENIYLQVMGSLAPFGFKKDTCPAVVY